MGHRLTKITTRTGDQGSTSLGNGDRVNKNATRIHVLGEIDELNCFVGLLRSEIADPHIVQVLSDIQNDLFDLGGELCIPGHTLLGEARVAGLETVCAQWGESLPKLKEFVIPGANRSSALAHVCRAVTRRSERWLVELSLESAVRYECIAYLNRLSDLMFILSRTLTHNDTRTGNVAEPQWDRSRA